MVLPFVPSAIPPKNREGAALWLAFQNGDLLVWEDEDGIMVPQCEDFDSLGIPHAKQHYLGQFHQQDCFSVEIPARAQLPPGYETINLYQLLGEGDDTLFHLAGRAKQIVEWDQNHQFCSRCGTPTEDHDSDRAKKCPSCGYMAYPRLSPCVIVLVTKGEEVLLARAANFPGRMFSTLAGFIEAGETIEDGLVREVWEEVGIKVSNLQYMTSQPWPFPHSLMIGFHAEYESGEIEVDGVEIAEARWWHVNSLPMIPPEGSISRYLIDDYVEKMRG